MPCRALLLAACLAAAPGTAHALTSAGPPGPPDARVLRAAGLRVQWPAPEQLWRGGQRVTVRVTPLRRRHRSATVSLVRIRQDGRDGRTLARRTLRAGRFTATLPLALGRRYALRLRVGHRATARSCGRSCSPGRIKALDGPDGARVTPAAPFEVLP